MAQLPQVPPSDDPALTYFLEQVIDYLRSVEPTANVTLATQDTANFSGGYTNRYLSVAYANSASGLDFSSSDTGRSYFATYNSAANVWSSNPADYVYFETNQGFGTTMDLYYQILGGRQITFAVATAAPVNYQIVMPATPIDLDAPLAGGNAGPAGSNGFSVFSTEIYRNSNVLPATPTGGTYTFSTGNFVVPTGWSSVITTANTGQQVYVSSAIFSTQTPNIAVGPANGWSTPAVLDIGNVVLPPSISVSLSPASYLYTYANALSNTISSLTFVLSATSGITSVPFSNAATDSNAAFVNNSFRIGSNSTSGLNGITSTYANITAAVTDLGDTGELVITGNRSSPPTSSNQDIILIPLRYRDSTGQVYQLSDRTVSVGYQASSLLSSFSPASGGSTTLQLGGIGGPVEFQYFDLGPSVSVINAIDGTALDFSAGDGFFGDVTATTTVAAGVSIITPRANITEILNYSTTGTPASNVSPDGYLRIQVGGTGNAYLPFYR